MSTRWTDEARQRLCELKGDAQGWGYQPDGVACVEPTVLACLALSRGHDHHTIDQSSAIGGPVAEWLAKIQRSDGSLPVAQGVDTPGWSTALGLLLWCEFASRPTNRERAAAWLLTDRGAPRANVEPPEKRILGDDPTLTGWPWADGTHSWVEPTALALMSLCRQGLRSHPRVDEGIRLIVDRCVRSGGWNCGNKSAFGTPFRALPGPTGMALLALAAYGERAEAADRSINYLRRVLATVRAPISLGWGVMALRAHGECPPEADEWLAESYALSHDRPQSTLGLALALLAAQGGEVCFVAPDLTMPEYSR